MFKSEFLPKAEVELSNAYRWYEEKQSGLGKKFFNELDHYLTVLENNPFQFPIKYSN